MPEMPCIGNRPTKTIERQQQARHHGAPRYSEPRRDRQGSKRGGETAASRTGNAQETNSHSQSTVVTLPEVVHSASTERRDGARGGALPNRGTRRFSRPKKHARGGPKPRWRMRSWLRQQHLTGKHIARETGVSEATVRRVLARTSIGLSRLKDLEPAEPVRRYERKHPGEHIHLNIKKLPDWLCGAPHRRTTSRRGQPSSRHQEFVHVCIDDISRVAFVQVMHDQRKESAVALLEGRVSDESLIDLDPYPSSITLSLAQEDRRPHCVHHALFISAVVQVSMVR